MPIIDTLLRNAKNLQFRKPCDLPLRMFFGVEIDGIIDTAFQNASGLSGELGLREVRETNRSYVVERPEKLRNTPVVLTQGVMPVTSLLFDWWMEVVLWEFNRKDYRRSCSIIQLMPVKGVMVENRRWNLYKAYPMRFEMGDLDSQSQEVAVDILTLKFEGVPELARL